jgi:rhamnulokinase
VKVLAFDYGASSGRAILGRFDGEKLGLEQVHRFPNDPVKVKGTLYWDILRLFHEMKQGILKCVQKGEGDISSIGIDTWGVDFGLLDVSGNLLGNPVHYRDDRNEGMFEEAFKIVPKKEIYDETGIQFLKFNTLYQLLSMKLSNSPLLEKARTLLFIPDLFVYFLTGEKHSERTIVSTSQMYNPVSHEWSYSLIEKLGLPTDILTDLIDAGNISGVLSEDIASELNVGRIPVVAVAEHDTGSAVLSVPSRSDRYAYLSSGTWSLLGIESSHPIINETTFALDYTNEGGVNRTTRLLKNIMGLWIYQECKRTWDKSGTVLSFDELEEMAEKEEPFLSFIDPDNDLFYSPGNMPDKVMEFCRMTGQRVPESKGAIVRCIMESLALKYRVAIEGLEKICGFKMPVLHIVGGGCRNKMLCQFTANAASIPVIAGPVEATSIGNIACQLMALGEVKGLGEARSLIGRSFEVDEYDPCDTEAWQEAGERFKAVLDRR